MLWRPDLQEAKISQNGQAKVNTTVSPRLSLVARAVSRDIASVTVSLQDLQAARNQRRRELRMQLTARRSLVELLTNPRPSQSTESKQPRRARPPQVPRPRAALG